MKNLINSYRTLLFSIQMTSSEIVAKITKQKPQWVHLSQSENNLSDQN